VALYSYRAISAEGEAAEGEMEAQDRDEVVRRLRAANMVPVRAEPVAARTSAVRRAAGVRRASGREAALFVRELAALLGAGLTVERALSVCAELAAPRVAREAERLLGRVRGGAQLSEAMAASPELFGPFHVAVARAGEAGGELDRALQRLAAYLERARAAVDNVRAALIYPTILLIFAGLSIVFMLVYVVPQFEGMFRQSGRGLPGGLAMLAALGGLLRDFGWLLPLAALGLWLGARRRLAGEGVRRWFDARLLRLPVAGPLVRTLECERFCRALGALLRGGVPLPQAVELAAAAVGNTGLRAALVELALGVREGRGFARPLAAARLFPDVAAELARVGEETGRLEAMLEHAAELMARDLDVAVRRLVAVAVPAVTIALGLVVAGMVLAVLTAVTSLYELTL